jgi:hypothetical protein
LRRNIQREQKVALTEAMRTERALKSKHNRKNKPTRAVAAPIQPSVTQTESSIAAPTVDTAPDSDRHRQVTIQARIDVGFGNALYLRGEGSGLSWSEGVPLTCVDRATWEWSGKTEEPLKFKLLLNDTVWSQGEDLTATPGQTVEIAPAF